MGICSSQMAKGNGEFLSWRPTVMIIHFDGRLEELNQPITVRHVLSQHSNNFVASAESMYVDSTVPAVPEDDELEVGQIYFVLPLSQLNTVVSLQELCSLAIKASIALGFSKMKRSPSNVARIVAQARNSCRILTGFDAISMLHNQARRSSNSSQRIGL